MSRPSDAVDDVFAASSAEPPVRAPRLGPTEWLRWAWRQLTSMRTALLLLLALAVAAVPGSLIPQRSADPNGVGIWRNDYPSLVAVADALQLFDVYTSAWFSAIYLLLFVSLVGCVVPRLAHHLRAMRAAPPRTPARFDRLPASRVEELPGEDVEAAVTAAERLLRRKRYRTVRYGASVSAERGYLRETGNLLFHFGLVGVLVAVFVGGGFTYTGQSVLVEGQTFINTGAGYDSLSPGRFFGEGSLEPFALRLDELDVEYEQQNPNAFGQPLDYTAQVMTKLPREDAKPATIKVNQPLDIGGTSVYLLGNGYAPVITVRNADGSIAYSEPTPFRPQGPTLESLGVVKAPDTTDGTRQIGLQGFFYPTFVERVGGTYGSLFPDDSDPLLTLNVWAGDLRLGAGNVPQNVYVLDTGEMEQVVGRTVGVPALELRPGETAELPDGLGTVTFDGVRRFAAFDVHRDPAQTWVALFVALSVLGLITSLLVPRRRMWVRVSAAPTGGLVAEYAALARGDDPGLDRAVRELAEEHGAALPTSAAEREPATV